MQRMQSTSAQRWGGPAPRRARNRPLKYTTATKCNLAPPAQPHRGRELSRQRRVASHTHRYAARLVPKPPPLPRYSFAKGARHNRRAIAARLPTPTHHPARSRLAISTSARATRSARQRTA